MNDSIYIIIIYSIIVCIITRSVIIHLNKEKKDAINHITKVLEEERLRRDNIFKDYKEIVEVITKIVSRANSK